MPCIARPSTATTRTSTTSKSSSARLQIWIKIRAHRSLSTSGAGLLKSILTPGCRSSSELAALSQTRSTCRWRACATCATHTLSMARNHDPPTLQIADTEAQQEAQIAHYKEVFNQMDWKGDGVLDEQVWARVCVRSRSERVCAGSGVSKCLCVRMRVYEYACMRLPHLPLYLFLLLQLQQL